MILNSLICTIVLIIFLVYGHKLSKRDKNDLLAIQSTHKRATVRFGGVAILCGIIATSLLSAHSKIALLILISACPVFFGGLLEDITGKVRPRHRLLAAFCSAGLAVLITGVYIETGDFWVFDKLFIFPLIAIPATLIISSGIVHAFNIIDGVNGFSAGIALITSCILGYTCQVYGEPDLSQFCYVIAVAIIPFLLVNFPFGYIFLGDSGAYTLGHLLTWTALALIYRHPEVSAWAFLLMFFWPTTEILLSVYRRFMSKTPSGAPDRFHFHQLIMQLIQMSFENNGKPNSWANPLSTLILLPVALVPMVVSLYVIENNMSAILVYLMFFFTYLILYILLVYQVKTQALHLGNEDLANELNHIFRPKMK